MGSGQFDYYSDGDDQGEYEYLEEGVEQDKDVISTEGKQRILLYGIVDTVVSQKSTIPQQFQAVLLANFKSPDLAGQKYKSAAASVAVAAAAQEVDKITREVADTRGRPPPPPPQCRNQHLQQAFLTLLLTMLPQPQLRKSLSSS